MKLTVRVKPNAKESKIISKQGTEWSIAVHAQPTDGKANDAVIALIAEEFDIAKSHITITRGHTAKVKTIEIS